MGSYGVFSLTGVPFTKVVVVLTCSFCFAFCPIRVGFLFSFTKVFMLFFTLGWTPRGAPPGAFYCVFACRGAPGAPPAKTEA